MEREADKPCRACLSVEDMMRRGKELSKAKKAHDRLTECPVDKDLLGRSTWNLLHTIAAHFPKQPDDEAKRDAVELMRLFGKMYPCTYCAADLRRDLEREPPNVNSRESFAQWMCRLHNKVNEKMGKALFDCQRLDERWRTGWKDGSCDQ